MEMQKITSVYFVGAGGIGMSALARYFRAKGKQVAGYDKTPSDLTARQDPFRLDSRFDRRRYPYSLCG